LAKPTEKITLLDIVLAVEGAQPAFRCTEIRQRGPNPIGGVPAAPCEVNAAMLKAERAYRAELAKVSIADIFGRLNDNDKDGRIDARRCAFFELRERRLPAS